MIAFSQMHVLFGMPHAGYLRNFEAGIAALLDRGHRVTVVTKADPDTAPIVARLQARGSFVLTENPDIGPHDGRGARLRATLDYWYYLQPQFQATPALRKRAEDVAPPFAVRMAHAPALVRRAVATVLRRLEQRRPVPALLLDYLNQVKPDVVL